MAEHIRTQAREAAITALTGLTTTGSRVHTGLVRKVTAFPALVIETRDEDISIVSMGGPGRTMEHTMQIVVHALVKDDADYQTIADRILKEVQVAIAGNNTLSNTVKFVHPVKILTGPEGDGDDTFMRATIIFNAVYYAALNAPDTPL